MRLRVLSDNHQVWGWSNESDYITDKSQWSHFQHIDGEMFEVSVARLKLQIKTRMMMTMVTMLICFLVSSVQAADLEIRIPNDELSQQDGYYRLDYRSVTRLASSSVTAP